MFVLHFVQLYTEFYFNLQLYDCVPLISYFVWYVFSKTYVTFKKFVHNDILLVITHLFGFRLSRRKFSYT